MDIKISIKVKLLSKHRLYEDYEDIEDWYEDYEDIEDWYEDY